LPNSYEKILPKIQRDMPSKAKNGEEKELTDSALGQHSRARPVAGLLNKSCINDPFPTLHAKKGRRSAGQRQMHQGIRSKRDPGKLRKTRLISRKFYHLGNSQTSRGIEDGSYELPAKLLECHRLRFYSRQTRQRVVTDAQSRVEAR
jgi:hypothetical protein